MTLVVVTFVATFVAVCAVGYLLFANREGRSVSPVRPPRPSEEREYRAAIEQKILHTIAWLHRLTGAPPTRFAIPLREDAAPGFSEKVLIGAVLVAIGGGVVLAMIAFGLQLLGWLEGPILRRFFSLLFQVSIRPSGAAALALAVLVAGLPLAKRFRRPERSRTGVVLIALSLATFWPLQNVTAGFDVPFSEYRVFLRGVGAFVSVCLFTGGFECIRRALNTPGDDSWEFMR
jgi:predicted permease